MILGTTQRSSESYDEEYSLELRNVFKSAQTSRVAAPMMMTSWKQMSSAEFVSGRLPT